jgi:hypothetical protein
MAGSLAGLILRGTLVSWHWSKNRDTVVYMLFSRSPPAMTLSETAAVFWHPAVVIGGWEPVIDSKIIERLAVEHGD